LDDDFDDEAFESVELPDEVVELLGTVGETEGSKVDVYWTVHC
jgi:hypothetical protein